MNDWLFVYGFCVGYEQVRQLLEEQRLHPNDMVVKRLREITEEWLKLLRSESEKEQRAGIKKLTMDIVVLLQLLVCGVPTCRRYL